MSAYRVLSPLHHDGRAYAPGERAELPTALGEPLAAAGVVIQEPAPPEPSRVRRKGSERP